MGVTLPDPATEPEPVPLPAAVQPAITAASIAKVAAIALVFVIFASFICCIGSIARHELWFPALAWSVPTGGHVKGRV